MPLSCYRRALRSTAPCGHPDPCPYRLGEGRRRRSRADQRLSGIDSTWLTLLWSDVVAPRTATRRTQERSPVEFQFTTRSQEAVTAAAEKAVELGNPQISSMHLLWALAGQEDGIGRAVLAALEAARREADTAHRTYLSTEHLMIGIALGKDAAARLLTAVGATPRALRDAVQELTTGDDQMTQMDSQNPESSFQSLEKFGVDLTELAREG